MCRAKDITFTILCLIKSKRKVRVLLYYVHMSMYNWINEKLPCVTIIHFYILVQFNIRRHFCASLSVRVSNSVQLVKFSIKYFKNNLFDNLHNYIPSRFTLHHTLLHTHMIQHMVILFAPTCNLIQKTSYDTNLSQFTPLHPRTLHTSSYSSTYDNISSLDWFDSKIDSIHLDLFPLSRIRNKLIQT